MGAPDQKHGLAWAKGQKPNPGPPWCTKPKPCDFDKASSYCPHRECRQALVSMVEKLEIALRDEIEWRRLEEARADALSKSASPV